MQFIITVAANKGIKLNMIYAITKQDLLEKHKNFRRYMIRFVKPMTNQILHIRYMKVEDFEEIFSDSLGSEECKAMVDFLKFPPPIKRRFGNAN